MAIRPLNKFEGLSFTKDKDLLLHSDDKNDNIDGTWFRCENYNIDVAFFPFSFSFSAFPCQFNTLFGKSI